ncbi:hypothetical protein Tsubulata_004088, partial [Turnera subulata]
MNLMLILLKARFLKPNFMSDVRFQVQSSFREFLFRELSAVAGAITITCLMVANLVGYVIGPSGINWLISQFLTIEGLPVPGGLFVTFYIGIDE